LLSAAPLLLLPVRITPRKNLELALHALAALRESWPDAALVVTGPPGPHNPANRAYFERLLNLRSELGLDGRAHFLAERSLAKQSHTENSARPEIPRGPAQQGPDYLPDAVIADFYRLADALLLPSREEGFGIPVLEAGLAGLPVFCADIPPLRALAGDQATYFSPEADPAALASAIARRLADDPVYELRRRVRRDFTWEGVYARQIAPLLDSLRLTRP
jgi:glycosyltransferase involved in cell wall biosynthesis